MNPHIRLTNSLFLAALFLLPVAIPAAGQSQEILLWPNGAPGSEGKTNAESVRIYAPTGDHVITDVNKPSITPYLPPPPRHRRRGDYYARRRPQRAVV